MLEAMSRVRCTRAFDQQMREAGISIEWWDADVRFWDYLTRGIPPRQRHMLGHMGALNLQKYFPSDPRTPWR